MAKREVPKNRVLLTTVTGEPFQPIRLYYSVPSRQVVTRVFAKLRCVDQDDQDRCWVWLYEDEAAGIAFDKPYAELPREIHPIVIAQWFAVAEAAVGLDRLDRLLYEDFPPLRRGGDAWFSRSRHVARAPR